MKKESSPLIETERLILRKFTELDTDDLFCLYSDEEVNTFLPWFPFKSVEETTEYLNNKVFVDYVKDISYNYAVVFKQTKKVIGYIGLHGIDENTASGDLGYSLLKDFWNKGIITEAGIALLKKLKENGFKYITATHDINNPKSGKVMEKIGMVYSHSYDEMWQPKKMIVTFKLYKINF